MDKIKLYGLSEPFPMNQLRSEFSLAVQEIVFNVKVAPVLPVNVALAVLSSALQDSIDVLVPVLDKPIPVSLYVMTIGSSGERKTAVDQILMKSVREFEAKHDAIYKEELDACRRENAAWTAKKKGLTRMFEKLLIKGQDTTDIEAKLKEHEACAPIPPRKLKMLYANTTPAALLHGLHTHYPSAILSSDEAATILKGPALNDLGMINSLWNGTSITVDRRQSESFKLEDVRFTMNLSMQPSVFDEFIEKKGDAARSMGFFARNLIAYPPSTQGTRFIDGADTSWIHTEAFHKRIKQLLEESLPRPPGQPRRVVKFSEEARRHWISMFNEIEQMIGVFGLLAELKDYGSKMAEMIARIAALFHVFEGKDEKISLDTLQRAGEIGGWYAKEFKRLFGKPAEVPLPEKLGATLEHWLRKHYYATGSLQVRKTFAYKFGPHILRNKPMLETAIQFLAATQRVAMFQANNCSTIQLNQLSLNWPPCSVWYPDSDGIYF